MTPEPKSQSRVRAAKAGPSRGRVRVRKPRAVKIKDGGFDNVWVFVGRSEYAVMQDNSTETLVIMNPSTARRIAKWLNLWDEWKQSKEK